MRITKSIANYASLVKLSHTVFALPFALIGFTLAVKYTNSAFELQKLIAVIACMVFARSAAMAFNRYLDADIDAQNIRTQQREIPAGIINKKAAFTFVLVNALLFVVATFFLNPICVYLSPVALFVILFYSYTKRFTALCHFVLGVGLALAPIGAYLAVTGVFSILPLLFSFAVLFWVSGFDIIYALQDIDFDQSQHLHSVPSLLGKNNALNLSRFLHVVTAMLIVSAGFVGHFNFLYWIGATLFISMLVYQHVLVKPHDLSKVNLAFFTTNGIASVLFSVFVILSLFI